MRHPHHSSHGKRLPEALRTEAGRSNIFFTFKALMQLLHLDSSVLGGASVSRQLSAELVARHRALHPGIQVVSRDLAADPALHLSGAHMAAFQGAATEDATITADLVKGNAYMDELFASDILVIGAPMYNLSIPTPLKAWIDRIAVAGKTFRYTATGPEGLLKNKRAFIASARGGVYSAGSPAAALEHQESYLIGLLAFLGVTNVTVVRAEGIAMGTEAKDAAVARALADIAAISA
jgi:FMN-dependent NADH-azoreductase